MADGIEGRDKSALNERKRNCQETGGHVFVLFSPFPLYSPLLMPHCACIPFPFLSHDMGLGEEKGKKEGENGEGLEEVMGGVPGNGEAASHLHKELPVLIS